MVTKIELFESPDLPPLDFCFWGLDEVRSLQKKSGHTRRIARSHFGCCCPSKEREDQLRQTTRDIRTRGAKCTDVGGGILQHLL
jgi:hypothetical protein